MTWCTVWQVAEWNDVAGYNLKELLGGTIRLCNKLEDNTIGMFHGLIVR